MQQRLGLAQALVGGPRLLLLDEPTSALDPVGRRTVRELLERLREQGVAVLLNSHLLTRGRARVRPRRDPRRGARRGRRTAVGAGSHAGGVEIETAGGVRRFAQATREQVPGSSPASCATASEIYGVRLLTSSLEEAYLDAVGERQEGAA